MEGWSDFAALTGGTVGVLIGLLFVGLSMHADRLEEEPPLRSRIAQVLVLFVGLLVSASVLTMPAPIWVLGILLIADAIGVGVPLLVLNHEAKRGRRNSRLERLLDRTNPNVICVSLLSTAGVLMLLGWDWGAFFVAGATLAGVVGGLVASWFVLLRPDPSVGVSADATDESQSGVGSERAGVDDEGRRKKDHKKK